MRTTLLALVFLCCNSLFAQQISRIKVILDEAHTFIQLASLGIETDHGKLQPGKYFISEFAADEIAKIEAAGFFTQVLVEDLAAFRQALDQTGPVATRSLICDNFQPANWQTPANYQPGTMGGYFRYQEMLDHLDAMAALYPHLFKARQPITTAYLTHEGRPVYWVKISDNPNLDETSEPEVLYSAVHHAREPNSLSQMIFYMWYLLENYDTNEEVKYLVDHVEMYFVPCLNPDGYIYNETTNPDGGGFWRKNRRNNNDGSIGVDLNRNYGYEWGFNNIGSSADPNSAVYRGPGPFSEPETQMMRDFCNAHEFQIAHNYHTYSNLLIFPWGYADSATPDHPTFQAFGSLMTRENNYLNGFASQTVGYTVNGNSDDWMYGEQTSKAKIFAMTPEVGPADYGFWPPSFAIDELNKACMYMNLMTAHLPLNYAELTPNSNRFISSLQGNIGFDLKKYGLAPGTLKVALEPVSGPILSTGSPKTFGLFHLESTSDNLSFTLDPGIKDGDTVIFNLTLENGLYTWRHRIERIFSNKAEQAFIEPGNDLAQWNAFSDWSITTETYYSAPSCITDSPNSAYLPSTVSEIYMKEPVTIQDATGVYLSFWAKWDIEEDEDFAQVLISVNGNNYIPLCGRYTEPGTFEQLFDEPVYDGLMQSWVQEVFDLTEYLDGDNTQFNIVFLMASDEFIEADGFYFDDLELTVVKENMTSTLSLHPSDFTLTTRPNPAGSYVIIDVKGEKALPDKATLQVFNALGQMMVHQNVQGNIIRLETGNWMPGVYQYQLVESGNRLSTGRFLVGKN